MSSLETNQRSAQAVTLKRGVLIGAQHIALQDNSILQVNPRYELHRTACCHVLVDTSTMSPVYKLNGPAAAVWALCQHELPVQEIVYLLCDEFGEQVETVREHVTELVDRLVSMDAIVLRETENQTP